MTTTIKVSEELRDRLKAQAARSGVTLGAHLANLADAAERRQRFETLRAQIASTAPGRRGCMPQNSANGRQRA